MYLNTCLSNAWKTHQYTDLHTYLLVKLSNAWKHINTDLHTILGLNMLIQFNFVTFLTQPWSSRWTLWSQNSHPSALGHMVEFWGTLLYEPTTMSLPFLAHRWWALGPQNKSSLSPSLCHMTGWDASPLRIALYMRTDAQPEMLTQRGQGLFLQDEIILTTYNMFGYLISLNIFCHRSLKLYFLWHLYFVMSRIMDCHSPSTLFRSQPFLSSNCWKRVHIVWTWSILYSHKALGSDQIGNRTCSTQTWNTSVS